MIEALLVANRGEIAVRAFRAANELGVRSIAVYVPEDRDSVHRLKADESWLTVSATSYSPCSSGSITASGKRVRFGMIATRSTTIPFGTRVDLSPAV
jgi:hypothetical protein